MASQLLRRCCQVVVEVPAILPCKHFIIDAKECLKKLREGGERKSEEVVELWEDCLADFSYKVSDSERE